MWAKNVSVKQSKKSEGYIENIKFLLVNTRDADKSLARPERKQATKTKDFDFHISYL